MHVRSGPFLLSLLLAVGLAASILLTREPTPIATASEAARHPRPSRRTATTNPACENGTAVAPPTTRSCRLHDPAGG